MSTINISNLQSFYKINSFLRSWKMTKLKPFFKKRLKESSSKLLPISLLPLLSKILEKIVHDQPEEFLCKNKILYRILFGLRKNYSTNTCLGYLTDKITTGFDKRPFHWNHFNWFTKSIWHRWPPNFMKENEKFRLFQVLSLWMSINTSY